VFLLKMKELYYLHFLYYKKLIQIKYKILTYKFKHLIKNSILFTTIFYQSFYIIFLCVIHLLFEKVAYLLLETFFTPYKESISNYLSI
jgi:hypothetical protein